MMTRKQIKGNSNQKGTGVKGRNKRTRFPGICEDAKALGVSRSHLYFVLTGERKSPRIEEYYRKKGVEV
jgi:hypothetical protein